MSNVKLGDLAIVVRSEMGNLGKIVKVLRPAGAGEKFRSADGKSTCRLVLEGPAEV